MPTWLAILIGAAIALFVGIAAWLTLGLKLLERREGAATWRGEVDTDRKSFKSFMKQVGETLKKIQRELDTVRQIMAAYFGKPLFVPKSPIQLTEYGETVSKEIDAAKWVERIAPTLEDRVRSMDAYEIQDFCFEYAKGTDHYHGGERTVIRDVAYRYGLEVNAVHRVLAIKLRNRLLKLVGKDAPE